jgi:hypothetical protein
LTPAAFSLLPVATPTTLTWISLSFQYTSIGTLQSFIHSVDKNAVNDNTVMATIFSKSIRFWLENGDFLKVCRGNLFHAKKATLA